MVCIILSSFERIFDKFFVSSFKIPYQTGPLVKTVREIRSGRYSNSSAQAALDSHRRHCRESRYNYEEQTDGYCYLMIADLRASRQDNLSFRKDANDFTFFFPTAGPASRTELGIHVGIHTVVKHQC